MSFPMHATLLLFALSNKDVRYLINIYTINTFFGKHADMKVASIAEKNTQPINLQCLLQTHFKAM